MPAFEVIVNDKSYHVEITSLAARPLQIIVDGQAFRVYVNSAQGAVAPSAVRAAAPVAAQPTALPVASGIIAAPMPGTILAVEVKPGRQVQTGEVLCYLEAMKMKNPIRTPHPGVVVDVYAQPGQSVAYGEPLFRVEQGV